MLGECGCGRCGLQMAAIRSLIPHAHFSKSVGVACCGRHSLGSWLGTVELHARLAPDIDPHLPHARTVPHFQHSRLLPNCGRRDEQDVCHACVSMEGSQQCLDSSTSFGCRSSKIAFSEYAPRSTIANVTSCPLTDTPRSDAQQRQNSRRSRSRHHRPDVCLEVGRGRVLGRGHR